MSDFAVWLDTFISSSDIKDIVLGVSVLICVTAVCNLFTFWGNYKH